MSTKIYNGYSFAVDSWDDLFSRLNAAKGLFLQKSSQLVNDLYLNGVQEHLDRAFMGLEGGVSLGEAHSIVVRRFIERKGRIAEGISLPMFDMSVEVCAFRVENRFLGVLFASNSEMKKLFSSLNFVDAFGYWDNTDPEEGVSESEWRLRGELWGAAMGESWIPSRNGVISTLCGPLDLSDISSLSSPFECPFSPSDRALRLERHCFEFALNTELERQSCHFSVTQVMKASRHPEILALREGVECRLVECLPRHYGNDEVVSSNRREIHSMEASIASSVVGHLERRGEGGMLITRG